MRRITLKSLRLTMFKGETERTTEFDPRETTLSGGNATGKSRHFDAFLWLLFGKDKEGRKDYRIKTYVDGYPLQRTNAEVVGVLDVDGVEITLKRAFVEEWVKPRGELEQVLKGNRTDYFWNDTPITATEYNDRINKEIIDEGTFKLLTNVFEFLRSPWKAQRDMLFKMAGTISQAEAAQLNEEHRAFWAELNGKSLEDFKKESKAARLKLRRELDTIQPRIDQAQKMKPKEENWDALNEELTAVQKELEETQDALTEYSERAARQNKALYNTQQAIRDAEERADGIVREAQKQEAARCQEANQERMRLLGQLKAVSVTTEGNVITALWREHGELKRQIESKERQNEALRNEWTRISSEMYNSSLVCSHCGQQLPEAMIAEAEEHFEKEKQARLEKIIQRGTAINKEIATLQEDMKTIEARIENEKIVIKEAEQKKATLEEQIAQLPEALPQPIDPETLPKWKELQFEIHKLGALLESQKATVHTDSTEPLKIERDRLSQKVFDIKSTLSRKEYIEKADQQIDELKARSQELSQMLAEWEKKEYTANQIERTRCEEAENRINNLFRYLTVRLFEYTLQDTNKENPIEICEIYVKGVPYGVANAAGQINAGIDIINALSRYFGVSAPVFIDNREGVNELIEHEAQIVNLVVNRSKELTVEKCAY